MFENKDIKQLRKVQSRIKELKASIKKLNSPELDDYMTNRAICSVLGPMLYGKSLSPSEFLELSDASIEYIQKLGQYLANMAEYADTNKVYEKEIKRLQKEERRLKDKLGIE